MLVPDETLIEKQPQEILERFVANVWNHPLVDTALINHRDTGMRLIKELVDTLDLKDSFAIPFGSTLWAVDEHSDHDYTIIVGNNDRQKFTIDKLITIDGQQTTHRDFFKTKGLDIFPVYEDELEINVEVPIDDFHPDPNPLILLLFTPNRFITGDISKANTLRLRFSQMIESLNTENQSRINLYINKYFNIKLLHWRDDLDSSFGLTKRYDRLKNKILEASKRFKNPAWIDTFSSIISDSKFHPPLITTISKALIFTEGKLE